MAHTLDGDDVYGGPCLRTVRAIHSARKYTLVSACPDPDGPYRAHLGRNLRKRAALKVHGAAVHLHLVLWSWRRQLLVHACAQFTVRYLFEQPRRKALQDGARSGPPKGSARPLRRHRSPLWGGTSERRRLRGEAGRGLITRRSTRSPGAVICCPIPSEFVQGGHFLCPNHSLFDPLQVYVSIVGRDIPSRPIWRAI
jgi:hypothetical protein